MKYLFLLLFTIGCVTSRPDAAPEKLYRKDMKLKINGVKSSGGVYVLPKQKAYNIKAYLYKKAVVFKISSCHREWVWSDPGDDVEFRYEPLSGLENEGFCPLELGGFDMKGQHSWAYIDFVDDEELEAQIGCNGRVFSLKGVSVCQCKEGLVQRIVFDRPVEVLHPERCNSPESTDQKRFELHINSGKCIYLFTDGSKVHRMTTIGYDDVMIRD